MKENTKSLSSIIEDISISKSASNIWDDILNGSEIFDSSSKFLNIFNNGLYCVRFLGPILKAKRLYVDAKTNLTEIVSNNELKEIIEENRTVFEKVINRIDPSLIKTPASLNNVKEIKNRRGISFKQNSTMQASSIDVLNSLFYKDSPTQVKLWQNCLLTNVYVKNISTNGRDEVLSARIKILPVPKTTCSELAMTIRNIKGSETKKMSGIYAYDIILSKETNQKNFPLTKIVLSDIQSFLTRQEISYIMNNGLIDIKKSIREYNRLNASKIEKGKSLMFYYFEDYQLPEEFMHGIYDEVEDAEFDSHLECIEENLHNLPPEAIGDYQSMGSVGSLEL